MTIYWAIILLVCGLAILWKSADVLVDGAVALAKRLGVSPLVIGLTVVAMGTSAPEVAASIAAAARGAGDLAIGNVYGSNIANLALVGGLCALIAPITITGRMLRREIPVMIASALLLWPVLHGLKLSRPEGIVLLTLFCGLILLTVLAARKEQQKSTSAQEHNGAGPSYTTTRNVLFVVIGLAGLTIGAVITLRGAEFIGELAGLSEAVIGLTIVAIGTSLPELVTCVVAARKGQNDISIGNLVGSNVFNTLLVTGTAGLIRPFTIVQRLIGIDYWIMIAVTVGFAIVALFRKKIGRTAGAALLCVYIGFIVYSLAYSG